MNTKLTLNIDNQIIESAKGYAKNQKVSLSKLIENYLNSLTKKKATDFKASPLVESLTGVIPSKDDTNFKKDYSDYLNEKYA